jgi:tRNA (adenine-N(1)-)-methyltransferase non-catalytic subunit
MHDMQLENDMEERAAQHRAPETAANAPDDDDSIIKEGNSVVFDINHGFKVQFIDRVSSSASFEMGRIRIPTSALMGHPYGTLFKIEEGTDTLRPVPYKVPPNEWKQDDHDFARLEEERPGCGNRQQDRGSTLDVVKLQEQGVRGETLVKTIEGSSGTFEDKTVLAQKKFRQKKERKHVLVGCARRPTAKTISEAYYKSSKHIKRIGHLRPDALAMALCLANVGAYQRVLVIEQSAGLVAGAVMERLGGYGACCVGHVGKNPPNLGILDGFGFNSWVRGVLSTRSLGSLLEEVKGLDDPRAHFTYAGKRFAREQMEGRGEDDDGKEKEEKEDQMEEGKEEQREDGGSGERDPRPGLFTSVIITATNYSQKSLLLSTMPLMAPSASFAVVSPSLQPLVDTMNLLRVRGFAVATTIDEPWQRDIQVLPKRTHPDMNMNHGGGYILSGTVTKRGRWIDLRQFRATV